MDSVNSFTKSWSVQEPVFEEARIQAQLQQGFYRLQFESGLEEAYRGHLYRRLLRRVPLVGITALGFFLVYSVLDYVLFPPKVSSWTIPIRLLVVCPTVILVMIAAFRRWPRQVFFRIYSASYAVGGFAIVAIILTAHAQAVMMPYDGLFLVLMFGYFLMALPFYTAVGTSWLMYVVYLLVEWLVHMPASTLLYNAFFLLTANLIGTAGSYVQESAQRRNYLNLLLVQSSRQRAEEENRAKTKFLATASHDLRQPLHAMNLLAAHLGDRLAGQPESDTVGKLQQSIEQLNQLLRSLLDISKLNIGIVKPKYQHFQLAPFVQGIADDFAALAKEQQIRFRAECPCDISVYSDPVLLERMVRNLLTNAFVHANAKSVELQVEQLPHQVILWVRDDGKGIAEDEVDKIFLEFHQGSDERNSQKSGLGLGLAIVKHLAVLMDYNIGVESEAGQGASFWIKLPMGLKQMTPRETPADTETWTQGDAGAVLLVENDHAALDAMANLLRSWGCQVVAAESSATALMKIVDWRPDLIVTDYRLSNGDDGLTLIQRVRAQVDAKLPAIVVTADTENELLDVAGNAWTVIAFKPLVPAQLQLMMRKLLNPEAAGVSV